MEKPQGKRQERYFRRCRYDPYATRAMESGMQPKVLQKLLGHASIKTTMDRYVHAADDALICGVQQFKDKSHDIRQ